MKIMAIKLSAAFLLCLGFIAADEPDTTAAELSLSDMLNLKIEPASKKAGRSRNAAVGAWVGTFTYGQARYKNTMLIENNDSCTVTVAAPAAGGVPETPLFVTIGMWSIRGKLFKIRASSCLSLDTATRTLREVPVNQSSLGGSKDIPITISGNKWVYTDPRLHVTVACIRQ